MPETQSIDVPAPQGFRPQMLVRSDRLLAQALRWAANFPRAPFYG